MDALNTLTYIYPTRKWHSDTDIFNEKKKDNNNKKKASSPPYGNTYSVAWGR